MKKNITINLFGQLYNIDEDAYELLEKYQKNIRSYFSRREGGEEVADDVEHRVAELFAELKEQGVEAITIEQVESIINRIGDPQEMEDAEEGEETAPGAMPPPVYGEGTTRRFFRDPEDRMLGGVISGATKYFGGTDPLPWRILFVLAVIFTWSTLGFIYLVVWALVPEARTAEERLQMRGEPVNPSTIRDEVMRGVKATQDFVANPRVQSQATGCLGIMVKIVLFLVMGFAILVLGSILLTILISMIAFGAAAVAGVGSASWGGPFTELSEFQSQMPDVKWWIWIGLFSGLILVVIPLVTLVRTMFRKPDSAPMSIATKATLTIIWVIAFGLALFSTITGVMRTKEFADKYNEKQRIVYHQENTRNGIFLDESSWRYLDSEGWKVVRLSGTDEASDSFDDPLYDSDNAEDCPEVEGLHLEADEGKSLDFEIQKTLTVSRGVYKIQGMRQVDGQGITLYAVLDSSMVKTQEFEPGVFISSEANSRILEDLAPNANIKGIEKNLMQTQWMPFSMIVEVKKGGLLSYGFSTASSFRRNPLTAREFSAAYVTITRISGTDSLPAVK